MTNLGELSDIKTNKVSCMMCGAADSKTYKSNMYSIGITHFDLVQCACGFVYTSHIPEADVISALYADPSYYNDGYNLGVETENYFKRKDELIKIYDTTIQEFEEKFGVIGDLLELGSAGGFLLEAARRRGWRVKGIEVSPTAVKFAREELHLDIFQGMLTYDCYPPSSFDLVIADNVLEHTPDPMETLKMLLHLTKSGGLLVVIVPTYVNSPYFRMLKALGKAVPRRFLGPTLSKILKVTSPTENTTRNYPYHMIEFNKDLIVKLTKNSGWNVESVEGAVPLPAEIFKTNSANLRIFILRSVFTILNWLMHLGLVPGARTTVYARKP